MKLYSKGEGVDVEYFHEFMRAHPKVTFIQPSPQQAPWHIQAFIPSPSGCDEELNFWPHVQKCYRKGDSKGSRVGVDEMHAIIEDALNAVAEEQSLFEASQTFGAIED